MLVEEQWTFLRDVARLILFAEGQGLTVTGGELWRTEEQQAAYVKAGLSKTMDSYHRKRLAIDLNIIQDGKIAPVSAFRMLGDHWESLSEKNRWGGNFGGGFVDAPHFERRV